MTFTAGKSPLEKLFSEAISIPASVVFVLSSLAPTKLSELWFSSLRTQHAGCFDADLCAHRNEGRDEEQMACDNGPLFPRLLSDTGVDTGERVTTVVRRGGGAGLHKFDCLIRLYFMVCQAK